MLAVEGVLGNADEFRSNMLPNDPALRLYASLEGLHRMVVVTSAPQPAPVEWWLRSNGVSDYVMIMTALVSMDALTVDHRAAQLRALRASRTDVAFVVDSDAATVAHAMSVGITGLLYGQPRPPAARVDLAQRRIRDWSAIEAETELRRSTCDG